MFCLMFQIHALWKGLLKQKEKIFLFLKYSGVPTDNGSKRVIRNVKVKVKASGQFIFDRGSIQYAVIIRSIIYTVNLSNFM